MQKVFVCQSEQLFVSLLFGSSATLELLHCILSRCEGNTGQRAAGFGSQVGSLRCGVEFPHHGLLSWADGEETLMSYSSVANGGLG